MTPARRDDLFQNERSRPMQRRTRRMGDLLRANAGTVAFLGYGAHSRRRRERLVAPCEGRLRVVELAISLKIRCRGCR